MSKKSVLVGSFGALVAVAFGQATASANAEWCDGDPPLQVVTPGGHNLMVNNMVYLVPIDEVDFERKGQTSETATVVPNGRGGTLIRLRIDVAEGVREAMVVSSVNRFQVSSQGRVPGGSVMILYLDVPIS